MPESKPNRIHLKINDVLEVECESSELPFDALEQKALGLLEYLKEQRYPPKQKDDKSVA